MVGVTKLMCIKKMSFNAGTIKKSGPRVKILHAGINGVRFFILLFISFLFMVFRFKFFLIFFGVSLEAKWYKTAVI